MFAAIDLDQLTIALATKPRLMEGLALLARCPQAGFDRQRRNEVLVLDPDQFQRILPNTLALTTQ